MSSGRDEFIAPGWKPVSTALRQKPSWSGKGPFDGPRSGEILEGIAEQIRQLHETVSQFAEVRALVPAHPLSADEGVWCDGAMDLAAAEKTFAISRTEMYRLMREGVLPYAVANRERLVPRRWLMQYLAKLAQERTHPGLTDPTPLPAPKGKPKKRPRPQAKALTNAEHASEEQFVDDQRRTPSPSRVGSRLW